MTAQLKPEMLSSAAKEFELNEYPKPGSDHHELAEILRQQLGPLSSTFIASQVTPDLANWCDKIISVGNTYKYFSEFSDLPPNLETEDQLIKLWYDNYLSLIHI